jgi:rfaE bifunctional protein kinase chain/domain
MDSEELSSLLSKFADLTILVIGDFFLDRYFLIDPDIAETSVETGLEAHQVVEIRNSPGAAGTVTNNLCALGVGRVLALGVVGDDGHGFDLTQGLRGTGVDTSQLISTPDRYTPTYTKPIRNSSGDEMGRFDVKNRSTTPVGLESQILDRLPLLCNQADGVIILDQVQESDCGVITVKVREALAKLASTNTRPILADSRSHIAEFRNVILKPNADELADLIADETDPNIAALSLAQRTDRPVIFTRGSEGIITSDGSATWSIPGIQVPKPIDIVGAGDTVSAAVTSALAARANLPDAALLGVIASSITVQQIGTTGTATPDQIVNRFSDEYPDGFEPSDIALQPRTGPHDS